jgi:NDP-sugar pyrophosphorylase family protein
MVAYSYDGQQLIGTGGALRRAYARLEQEFVVTYGDSYLPFDYSLPLRDLREHPEALATMCVYRNDGALGASNVALAGDLVARYDKSRPDPELNCIDYGAIALRRSVLQEIEDGAVWDLSALWSKLARKRQLRALVVPERFYEIGSPEGRSDFEDYLRSEVVP